MMRGGRNREVVLSRCGLILFAGARGDSNGRTDFTDNLYAAALGRQTLSSSGYKSTPVRLAFVLSGQAPGITPREQPGGLLGLLQIKAVATGWSSLASYVAVCDHLYAVASPLARNILPMGSRQDTCDSLRSTLSQR